MFNSDTRTDAVQYSSLLVRRLDIQRELETTTSFSANLQHGAAQASGPHASGQYVESFSHIVGRCNNKVIFRCDTTQRCMRKLTNFQQAMTHRVVR